MLESLSILLSRLLNGGAKRRCRKLGWGVRAIVRDCSDDEIMAAMGSAGFAARCGRGAIPSCKMCNLYAGKNWLRSGGS